MYKWKIQSRFASEKHISEWLTISHSKTRAGAERRLNELNSAKGKYTEYRMIRA